MAISLPLSQDDRNRLTEEKEKFQDQNSQLANANETNAVDVAELLLLDIPSKKQTDSPHTDIYFYEEELRRLDGRSLPYPLQEQGFIITDSVSDARLYINDGRFIITESAVEVANLPVIPFRGFSKSTPIGTDFDIWSRDRFGSSTSKPTTAPYTIDNTNENIKVDIDGTITEMSLSSFLILPQTLAGATLGSSITVLFQNAGYADAVCSFNEDRLSFTITSGTAGSSSSVQVLPASSNDMRTTIGFDVQHTITGKYQNNLLNVEIDGVAAEIQISDFRKCEVDAVLGDNNDDIGFFWSGLTFDLGYIGNTRLGPLFCSGFNNGDEVAQSIQAKLREVGTGGFENAICNYFSDEEIFQIYSGTFGTSSSVKVLAASDSLRDSRSLLGFNLPQEEIGNEDYYFTIGELSTKLGTFPNITVSGVGSSSRLSHSALYLSNNGIKIATDWQDFIVATTDIYDEGSRGQPRLYLDGKLPVNSNNNKINFFETQNVEKTASITAGSYTQGEFRKALEDALNSAGDSIYTVELDTQTNKFTLRTDSSGGSGIFSILWNSGKDAIRGFGYSIGFDVTSDDTGAAGYTSDNSAVFQSEDYFNPYFVSQFYGIPLLLDDTVDEASAILREERLLTIENSTTLLTDIKNLAVYDNEVALDGWESLASLEYSAANQEYNALRVGRGVYGGHISESDSNITNKTTALTNLIPNRTNLSNLLTAHGNLVSLASNTKDFVAGVDFTNEGTETFGVSVAAGSDDKKIYNNPELFVQYLTGSYQVPGRWNLPGLFTTSITYTPEPLSAFQLINTRTGVRGFSHTPTDVDAQYDIIYGADTSATVLSSIAETYDLSDGDTIKMKVDGSSEQTATIDATSGYTESTIATTDGFVIKTGVNDKINIEEVVGTELTGTLISGFYTGVNLAAEIVSKINGIGNSSYVGDYNVSIVDKFTFTSDGTIIITGGVNDKIDFEETISTPLVATLTAGTYAPAALAIEIALRLTASGSSLYTVTYVGNKFNIVSDGGGGTGILNLLWNTGVNSGTSVGNTIGFTVSDDTGSLSYTSDNESGIFRILWNSGSNSGTSVALTTGFDNIDDTGTLIYSSDNTVEYSVITGVNDRFTVVIDGTSSAADIVISQGIYSSANLLIEMATQIAADASFSISDFTVTYPANKFRITSTTKGTGSTVTIAEVADDFLQTVKLDGDVPVVGGGDVGNIDAVTAAEIASILNGEITGISSVDDSGKVRITTSSTNGTVSAIEITGGTAIAVIGFSIGIVIGIDKNNRLKVDIDGDTSQNPIELSVSGSPIAAATVAVDIQSKLQSIGGGGYTAATCTFNETTVWQTFPNQLRIISGTYGIASTVDGSNRTIIISASNNKINFEETGSVELTATLTNGFYNGTTLAVEIQTQLNAVGASIYTVGFVSTKMTVTSNGSGGGGIFNLLFGTGTDVANSTRLIAGYFPVDHTGSLSYISDGLVKIDERSGELGFDSQTQEQGHGVTAVTATIDNSEFSATLTLDTGGGARKEIEVDITVAANDKISELISTVNAVDFYTCELDFAYLLGRIADPFRLQNGDTLIVNPNGAGNQTITFDAVRGKSESATDAHTRIFSGSNDRIKISVNGGPIVEIILGTQMSSNKIATRIEQEVRGLAQATSALQAAYSQFTCYYNSGTGKFVLESGTGGTGSSVVVTDATTNNAAVDLNLGVANGGTETAGSGDFVNSSFATITEVFTKINATAIGFAAAGPNYLKLTSTVSGLSTRIQVSGTAASKLGYGSNSDSNSFDFSTIDCSTVIDFTAVDIKSPTIYTAARGWETDKGNVRITYYTIDDSEIVPRQSAVSTRLPTIAPRKPQIPIRAAAVVASLIPSLYEQRRDGVDFRLNKKTGSYIKVGDKFGQKENQDNLIVANTTAINEIDAIL